MMDYLPPDCPPHDTIIYLTLDDSIEKIKSGVSVRCYNGIRGARIRTIAELMEYDRDKLMRIRNLGKSSVDEIIKFLNSLKSGRGLFRIASSYEVQKFENENDGESSLTFYDEAGVLRDDIPLENLNLSGRSYNWLKRSGYHLASQLVGLTESQLFKIKNLGSTSVNEIMSAIKSLHFSETEMKSPTIKENVSCKTFVSKMSKAFQNIHGGVLYVELSPIFLKAEEIGENISNRELFKNGYLRNAVKDEIFLFLSGLSFGAYLDDIFELFPENTVEIDVIGEIADEMKSEGKIADEKFGNRIECKKISVFEHIQNVLKEKENKYYEMLFKRLQGLTLEEIAVQYSITKERVRQIVEKMLCYLRKTFLLAEDRYIDIFQKYDFSREDFSAAFGEDESVYNYLRLVCENPGTKPMEECIEDGAFPAEVRYSVKKVLAERSDAKYVIIGGERLYKSRQNIADYVVRTYFKDDGSLDAFLDCYAMTLEYLGLAEDAKLAMNDSRAYENFFFDSEKVLWKFGRRFRFYDMESRDFTEFFRELALERYNDVEYSTLKFFREYPGLMRKYDIRDEYELHNLLKKLYRKMGNDSINFTRMPKMEFGKADREAQVLDLLKRLSPVRARSFCAAYEEEYGIQAATVMGGFLQNISIYLRDGVYDISAPKPLNLRAKQVSFEFPEMAEQINIFDDETPNIIEKLTEILSSRFANGFRLNSPIELARFRSFAADDFNEEITFSDEELKKYIAACGTSFDGKVYVVSPEAKDKIKDVVDRYFADGAQFIFYAEFFAKNENWLFGTNVVSEEVLVVILRKLFPNLSFKQTHFGFISASVSAVLENEILRVWGDDVLMTYERLAEKLEYIPIDRIKSFLGQNGDFIWNSISTFSHITRIEITESEKEYIREIAAQECSIHGYVSIATMPLTEIADRNHELSINAVHNAVHRICLSEKFDKYGKIVTRKGEPIDVLTIMKKHCRTIEKCSLDDLLNYTKKLTGDIQHLISMEAANSVLVRVDKETYVADKYVHFDIEATDEAIERFVKDDYLPLKFFITFGIFPDCGHIWNLFLLESYCRRFSHNFRFDVAWVNSRNIGAVIRKGCGLSYTEIMADAVAKADIQLNEADIGKFLYENGYICKSTNSKIGEIIGKAKIIKVNIIRR